MKRRFDPNKLITRFRHFTFVLISISLISFYLAYESKKDAINVAKDFRSIENLNELVKQRKSDLHKMFEELPPLVSEPIQFSSEKEIPVDDILLLNDQYGNQHEFIKYYKINTECFVFETGSEKAKISTKSFQNLPTRVIAIDSNSQVVPSYEMNYNSIDFGTKFSKLSVENAKEEYQKFVNGEVNLFKMVINLDFLSRLIVAGARKDGKISDFWFTKNSGFNSESVKFHPYFFTTQKCEIQKDSIHRDLLRIQVEFKLDLDTDSYSQSGALSAFHEVASDETLESIMNIPGIITEQYIKANNDLTSASRTLESVSSQGNLNDLFDLIYNKDNLSYLKFPALFFTLEEVLTEDFIPPTNVNYANTFEKQFPGITSMHQQLKSEIGEGSLTIEQIQKISEYLESNKVRKAPVLAIEITTATISNFYWIFLVIFFILYISNIIFLSSLLNDKSEVLIDEPWMGIASHSISMMYIIVLFILIPGLTTYYTSANDTLLDDTSLWQYSWIALVGLIALLKWQLVNKIEYNEKYL